MKKILSVLLVLVMVLGMLPVSTFATDNNSVTVGFAVVDCVNGNIEVMHKELTVEPGLASKYLDGQYGASIGLTVEVGENDVTPIDVLVAAHLDEYGESFTDSTAENYITGFDYISKMFGVDSEVTYTTNGIMPYTSTDQYGNTGYAVNQYIVQPDDEICFYRIDYNAYPPSVYTSFDKTEYEVSAGEEVTLKLGFCATMGYVDEPTPAANAEIYMLNDDGSVGSKIKNTDESGNVSVSFETAGTYYLTCKGEISYYDAMWGMESTGVLSPAYTKITVVEEQSDIPPVQAGEYDVTVYVGPATANVEFYECSGFDANGFDVLGKKISATDNGVNQDTSYHTYTMKLDKGTYSFRATDENGNSLGGMTFDIPTAVEVDNIESKASEIYLRQVDVYTTTKIDGVFANESQYSTQVIDSDGKLATAGKAYLDSSSRTRYPYMIYANGNAELYTVKLIPTSEVNNTYNLGTNVMLNYAISKGTTATTKSGTLPALINAVITAPSGSKVQVFNQLRNFYTEEVGYSSKEEADGTTSYTYRLPKSNGNHTYRVSMEGKITRAGYLKLTSEENAKTDIVFGENENPQIRPEYDRTTTIGSRMEDNILLNINSQNYLRMDIGETFKARAYRAWQIINSDTANIMIEPDFEYKIISGDSITLQQQGQNAVIKAVKDGISIVEVTYDAIEIGGNTNYTGIYGAIDPMRKGLFVVNVGGNTETEISLPKWDSDFDTVYFTEETGTYNFKPTSSEPLTVTCNDTEVHVNADGSYTLPVIQGNNIVSVKAGNTTEYIVIKGNKVTVNIENKTSPGETIKQGDTVAISFDGLHIPMPKFSGIYNPGFGNTVKTSYVNQNGITVQSNGAQYNFISNHTISMKVYDKGTVKLTNGYIPLTSMGFVPGAHRELTDTGVGANFNAVEVPAEFSHLPDVSFEVAENEDVSYMYDAQENYCNLSKVNILCGTSSYQKSFMFDLKTETTASKKNNATTFSSINSEFPFTVNVTPVNDVNIAFRYWELGDTEKKTAALTPGKATSLDNTFTGEKPIYMEIAVTPKNPVFGGEKVYSYVAYSASKSRPILKTLSAKDTSGNEYTLYSDNNSGVAYTETDYICYISEDMNEAVISLARLNGTTNITVAEESQTVKTSTTTFSAVPTEKDETTVTIEIEDGEQYTIKFIKIDKVINKKVVYDNEKIAVSFVSPKVDTLSFYIASHEANDKRLEKLAVSTKDVVAGENVVYLSLSSFKEADNITLFVWDGNLSPIFDKTNIILE